MFSILDPRLWLAFLLAIGIGSGVAYLKGRTDGKREIKTQWQAATAQANIDARETERLRQRSVDKAVDAAAARETGLRADAARAAGAARGLRDDLAALKSRSQSGTAETERAIAAALGVLLAESSEAYGELAARCDRHVNDIRTLIQAWPK